jgi:predicted TIM-barrel fold metal-dependent hydrolase
MRSTFMRARLGVDCHNHIIDPVRFPFAPRGGYRPRPDEGGSREAFAEILDAHRMHYALLVQPSCYGTDNRAILDAIAWKPGRFKAIGVLDPSTSERELDVLRARGLVGVRFNLPFHPEALQRPTTPAFLARLKALGWFVQVYGQGADWVRAAPILQKSGVKLVIDHIGLENVEGGLDQKGFQAVLALGRDTDAIIKLSAPFRASRRGPAFGDIDPFVHSVLQNFGVSRCVWGSDWPFLNIEPRPTYDQVLAPLARWLSADDCRAVLWENPCRLFGFSGDVLP